jgi:PAS domain S-box-containing protein
MTIPDVDLADALRASRERYRALLLAALDCVVAIDHRGCVLEWSPAAERTFGWTAEEAVGADMAELIVPPALRPRHRAGFAYYLGGGEPRVLDRRIEITAVRRDGEEFPVELTITRIEAPGDPVFVGYLRDITERHRAEAELRASRARIVTAADAARRRLERDLHDGAQQLLVGLALTLRLARRKVGEDDALAAELLEEAIEDLTAATKELRELARGLHPAVLTEGGLEPALTGLAKRSKVPVRIEHAPEGRLPAAVEITAYFVVAEALTNVARYAEACSVTVSARQVDDMLVVEVRDDGCGGADASRGSGLRGLDDRVSALGGRLVVDSPAGEGTGLRAELPCAS